MHTLFSSLGALVGIYSVLIFIRIILSWFSNSIRGKPVDILFSITDPYLNWWRNKLNLRIGVIDLSVIVAITALSLVQSILYSLARSERISIGNIIAIIISYAWNITAFILGFLIVVLVLRIIAHITGRNMSLYFWQMVESVSRPVLYKINRMVFGNRLTGFISGLVISIFVLAVLWFFGGVVIRSIVIMFAQLSI